MDNSSNGHKAEVEETSKIIVNLVKQFMDNSLNGYKADVEEAPR